MSHSFTKGTMEQHPLFFWFIIIISSNSNSSSIKNTTTLGHWRCVLSDYSTCQTRTGNFILEKPIITYPLIALLSSLIIKPYLTNLI